MRKACFGSAVARHLLAVLAAFAAAVLLAAGTTGVAGELNQHAPSYKGLEHVTSKTHIVLP
jgi:hypothetical protein